MTERTRTIGLSLGADLCWPACYEAIMQQLDLRIPVGDDTVRFETPGGRKEYEITDVRFGD